MKNSGGSLGFNGQDNADRVAGYSTKYQSTVAGIPAARENYGRGPTKVGSGSTGSEYHPAATAKGGKINGGTSIPTFKANVGRGPTKGNC